MAPDSDFSGSSIRVTSGAPGMLLIILGCVLLFLLARYGEEIKIAGITNFVLGFAFVIAAAGIVFLFRTVTSGATQEATSVVGSSDVEEAVRQLGKNYDILRRQATQGFVLAGTFMTMGIVVILTGTLGDMFGFSKATSNLTTVAGVVVEVVSGLGLYLFKETFKQLNATSEKLYEMWKILAAFKKAEDVPNDRKAEVMISLINKMVDIAPIAKPA
jgi:hypothetical protein